MLTLTRSLPGILMILYIATTGFAADAKVTILTGVPPHAWLAKRITGDMGQVSSIVNSGVDPHTFEPTNKQVAEIYKADLIIHSGLPFERRLFERLPHAKQKIVIDLSNSHHDHNHEHGTCDIQHSWLSPEELLKQTELISSILIKRYPDQSEPFKNNTRQLKIDITNAQTTVSNQLARLSSKKVYIFHPALEAFAEEFDLEQIAIEHEGKSPSPRRLRKIIAEARKENIKAIFTHPQFDKKGAEAVSSATRAKLIEFDPLAYDAIANILRLAKIIAEQNK